MITQDSVKVFPSTRVSGTVRVPGDKSISHRAAILSAVASGRSTITGYLMGEDCVNTLKAVAAMGAVVDFGKDVITVTGTGGAFRKPAEVLDMGNSGTGMRLMAGLLAGQPFTAEMTGDASLRSRPMKRIKDPLEKMGARIDLLGPNGCAPVRVTGGGLRAIEYVSPVASAQVKSCVLLAGLFANGTSAVVEPKATRDHSERMLKAAGASIRQKGLRVEIDGGAKLKPQDWVVPGDFSSSAFWLVAAACREGSDVTIENVGLNPKRTALIDVLRRMGADVSVSYLPGATLDGAGEPIGSVRIRGTKLNGTEIGGDEIPNLIDELPIISVAAVLAEGRTVIRDAHELRVKESDRISTMARNLARFGIVVEEKPDGMIITGPAKVRGGVEVDSHGDHRIAMSMSVLTLFADSPATVTGTACVATSYPEFWEHLARLTDQRDAAGHDTKDGGGTRSSLSSGTGGGTRSVASSETKKHNVIAIDGPSASGKSTVAKRIAARTGRLYVDSGALYRAIAWRSLETGIQSGNVQAVISMLAEFPIKFSEADGAVVFTVEGRRLGAELRTQLVNTNVSWVAAIPEVRSVVNVWLRSMGRLGSLVIEGRDIGTVVFPDASHKFYLDASPEERAKRRFSEISTTEKVSKEEIGESLKKRDTIDKTRKVDPLKTAPDAIVIDSTGLGIDDVVEVIVKKLESKA